MKILAISPFLITVKCNCTKNFPIYQAEKSLRNMQTWCLLIILSSMNKDPVHVGVPGLQLQAVCSDV